MFRDHEIDAAVLPELAEEHLKELGLSLGPRVKLLKAITRPQPIYGAAREGGVHSINVGPDASSTIPAKGHDGHHAG